jgi:hypothetical protein
LHSTVPQAVLGDVLHEPEEHGGEFVRAEAAAAEYTLPAKYVGYTNNPDRVKLNVAVIYDELKK